MRRAWPQDFGHALHSPPTETGALGPPPQRPHPQALQPAVERSDEPARPRDGKVVEPAFTDSPQPPSDLPDVVVPALAQYLADTRQGPVDRRAGRAPEPYRAPERRSGSLPRSGSGSRFCRPNQAAWAAAGRSGRAKGKRAPIDAGASPRAEQCSGDAAVGNTPMLPVANHAVAQNPGAGHAGAPLPQPELSGNATAGGRRQPPSNTGSSRTSRTAKVWPAMSNASPFRAPLSAPVSAAPSSDEAPDPQLLPRTDLPAPAPAPAPVAAPSESLRAAPRVPESSRDDPFVELSPGPVSAAPLLHPQRQRELIEQAAGMSTRQVASLLTAAAPGVVPPRDTVRAVAPDRYTLKVSIDQECEQGLRRLKGLLSHLDPRMSWGDLVTRLVVLQPDRNGCYSGSRGITFTLGGDGSEVLRDPPQGVRTGRIDPVGKDRTGGGLPPAECADPAVGRPGRTRTWSTRHEDRGAGGGHSTDGRESAQALCTGRLRGCVETPQAEPRAGNGAGWRRRGAVGRDRL